MPAESASLIRWATYASVSVAVFLITVKLIEIGFNFREIADFEAKISTRKYDQPFYIGTKPYLGPKVHYLVLPISHLHQF